MNNGFRVALKRVPASSLSTGLVAYYSFDGNASDMSGNGNHGTVNGATLGTDRHGVAGKAYDFDGVNDWILFPKGDALDEMQQTLPFPFGQIPIWDIQSWSNRFDHAFNGSTAYTAWRYTHDFGFNTRGHNLSAGGSSPLAKFGRITRRFSCLAFEFKWNQLENSMGNEINLYIKNQVRL